MRNLEPVEPTASKSSGRADVRHGADGVARLRTDEAGQAVGTSHRRRQPPKQVETRIRPALGDIRLADLSADHLERQYAEWTDVEGLSDKEDGLWLH